jgi:hypothetical protein
MFVLSIKLLQKVPLAIQPIHSIGGVLCKYFCISNDNSVKFIA